MYILKGKMVWFRPSMILISEHSLFHGTTATLKKNFFLYSVEMHTQEKL